MKYYLKIGEVVIRIELDKELYFFDYWNSFINDFLGGFLIKKETANLAIRFTGEKGRFISFKDKKISFPFLKNNELVFDQTLNQQIFLFCLEKSIENCLSEKRLLIMHAASFINKDVVYIVCGESGSGKSTLLELIGDKVLSDDSIILGYDDLGIFVYPSPFGYKKKINIENKKYRISKILTVRKNENLSLKKISKTRSFVFLMDQIKTLIHFKSGAKMMLEVCKILSKNFWQLSYKKGIDKKMVINILGNEKI